MNRRLILSLSIAFGLTTSSIQLVQADGITVKILEIPTINVKEDGLKNWNGNKISLSFLEPYSVEFSGTQAMKYSTCESFLDATKNLTTTWTISGKSESRQISKGNVLYTIAITKIGLQCVLSKRDSVWWDEDTRYSFASGEQSIPMTISISQEGNKLAESTGILRNPNFSQPAPEIVGISRGDVVNSFARFKFNGSVPAGPYQSPPKVTLCPVGTNGYDCGWGYIDEKNEGVIIADPSSYGKSATLEVQWAYTNSAGESAFTTSKIIGLSVQQSKEPIPWSVIEPSNKFSSEDFGLHLDLQIYCDGTSIKSNSLTCRDSGSGLYSRSNKFSVSKLRAQIKFNVKSTADGCLPSNADSVYLITGESKSIIFTNLGKPKYNVALKLSSAIDIQHPLERNDDPSSLSVTTVTQVNRDRLFYSGAKCHEIIPAKVIKVVKPTGKVDKSSNAYKTMYEVGQNFARLSLASDSANSQCTSARQSGVIYSSGIPTYLGPQAYQIKSYLNTASGFQGCIDGFGH